MAHEWWRKPLSFCAEEFTILVKLKYCGARGDLRKGVLAAVGAPPPGRLQGVRLQDIDHLDAARGELRQVVAAVGVRLARHISRGERVKLGLRAALDRRRPPRSCDAG